MSMRIILILAAAMTLSALVMSSTAADNASAGKPQVAATEPKGSEAKKPAEAKEGKGEKKAEVDDDDKEGEGEHKD